MAEQTHETLTLAERVKQVKNNSPQDAQRIDEILDEIHAKKSELEIQNTKDLQKKAQDSIGHGDDTGVSQEIALLDTYARDLESIKIKISSEKSTITEPTKAKIDTVNIKDTLASNESLVNMQDIDFQKAKAKIETEKAKIEHFNANSIESFLKLSSSILEKFTGKERILLEAVRGSLILDKIDALGLTYYFDKDGKFMLNIESGKTDMAQSVSNKMTAWMMGNLLSSKELQYALVARAPSFARFSSDSRLENGAPGDFNGTRYIEQLEQKRAVGESLSPLDLQVLASKHIIQNLPLADISSAQDSLALLAKNPPAVSMAPSSSPAASHTGPVQDTANKVTGKAGEFAGNVADNMGGFASGFTEALGKGFEKGGAIGGLAVALIMIVGLWKGLNKEWDTKIFGKQSGWTLALGAFAGKSGYDMMKEAGLIDEAKEKAKALAGDVTTEKSDTSSGTSSSPDVAIEKAEKEPLSPTQKIATEKVNTDPVVTKLFNTPNPKYSAKKEEYLAFLNAHPDISMAQLLHTKSSGNPKANIFDPSDTLDLGVTMPDPNTLNPIILKAMLRVYVFGLSIGLGELKNKMTTDINPRITSLGATKDKTILEVAQKQWNTAEAEKKAHESVTPDIEATKQKILTYKLSFNGKEMDTSGYKKVFGDQPDGNIELTIRGTIGPAIKLMFDNSGKLITKEVQLLRKTYLLSQTDNIIIATESSKTVSV